MEIILTDDTFKAEVLESQIPALVDFWAPWCGPCKIMNPILAKLAQKFEGKLKVGKLNVDEQGKTAMDFNVMSIPTMIFFKGGEKVDQQIGAMTEEALVAKIEKLLSA